MIQSSEEPPPKKMATFTDDASNKKIEHILFIIAMEQEAQPLLTKLNLPKIDNLIPNSPCLVFSGEYKNGVKVSVVTNGKCARYNVDNVGTVPAALTSFLAINQLKPDLIINAGKFNWFAVIIPYQTKNNNVYQCITNIICCFL